MPTGYQCPIISSLQTIAITSPFNNKPHSHYVTPHIIIDTIYFMTSSEAEVIVKHRGYNQLTLFGIINHLVLRILRVENQFVLNRAQGCDNLQNGRKSRQVFCKIPAWYYYLRAVSRSCLLMASVLFTHGFTNLPDTCMQHSASIYIHTCAWSRLLWAYAYANSISSPNECSGIIHPCALAWAVHLHGLQLHGLIQDYLPVHLQKITFVVPNELLTKLLEPMYQSHIFCMGLCTGNLPTLESTWISSPKWTAHQFQSPHRHLREFIIILLHPLWYLCADLWSHTHISTLWHLHNAIIRCFNHNGLLDMGKAPLYWSDCKVTTVNHHLPLFPYPP